jgi:ubiquinone/menaquinone biosynthesis C-methylase UbiE
MGEGMIRVDRTSLKSFAWGNHVDSPIYYTGSWPVRELQWRKLGALVKMAKGESGRVLDLCCGNGVLLPTLSRMFDQVVGLDIHTEAASVLRSYHQLRNVFLIADNAYSMCFKDDSFDFIFAASCLEHFRDLDKISREISRVLKPGGKLFYLCPTENLLYCIGRKLLGYTKPIDHYWTADLIEWHLKSQFKPVTLKSYPSALLPIYRMGVWKKS